MRCPGALDYNILYKFIIFHFVHLAESITMRLSARTFLQCYRYDIVILDRHEIPRHNKGLWEPRHL
jgi:hypothetical protein